MSSINAAAFQAQRTQMIAHIHSFMDKLSRLPMNRGCHCDNKGQLTDAASTNLLTTREGMD